MMLGGCSAAAGLHVWQMRSQAILGTETKVTRTEEEKERRKLERRDA